MKYTIALLAMTVSLSSFGATCKLSSAYYEGFSCASISTKIAVSSEEDCRLLASETRNNKFFGILTGKHDKVLRTKYTFKDGKRKIVDKIIFEDSEDYCGF